MYPSPAEERKDNDVKIVLKIGAVIILFILMALSVNALIFKQGEPVNLIQTCSNCTYNNITSITAPNGSLIIGSVRMTKVNFRYNYTLNNTASIGNYIVCGVGDLVGVNTIWCYDFDVTIDGTETTTNIGIIIALSTFSILFIVSGLVIFYRKEVEDK